MIIDYDYENEKILLLDDKEGIIEKDYQDNIQNIIATKNVIEVLENKIEEIEKNRIGYKLYKKIGYGFLIFLALCSLGAASYLVLPILMEGTISSIIFGIIISLCIVTLDSYVVYEIINTIVPKTNNKINICSDILNKLEPELKNQKDKLNVLELSKTNNLKIVYANKKENKKEFISLMNRDLKYIRKILEEYKQQFNKNQDLEDKLIDESLVLKLAKK